MGSSEQDIENIIKMLDAKTSAGVSRINVHVSEDAESGKIASVSHHGRCDVGSAWAKGTVPNFECKDIPDMEEQDTDNSK